MRAFLLTLACATFAACAQAPTRPGPEDVVAAIYAQAEQRAARNQTAAAADLPLTDDFADLLAQASAAAQARNEPFIDGDLALDCQECAGFSDLSLATTAPPANHAATVEARFRIALRDRVVIWDLRETPQGWRIDNIRAPDGRNLRNDAQGELAGNSE